MSTLIERKINSVNQSHELIRKLNSNIFKCTFNHKDKLEKLYYKKKHLKNVCDVNELHFIVRDKEICNEIKDLQDDYEKTLKSLTEQTDVGKIYFFVDKIY